MLQTGAEVGKELGGSAVLSRLLAHLWPPTVFIGVTWILVGALHLPASRAQSPVHAQPSGGALKFEVASIRACDESTDSRGGGGSWSPGRLTLIIDARPSRL